VQDLRSCTSFSDYVPGAGREADEFEVFPGPGVRSLVARRTVLVGSRRIIKSNGVNIDQEASDDLDEQEKGGGY